MIEKMYIGRIISVSLYVYEIDRQAECACEGNNLIFWVEKDKWKSKQDTAFDMCFKIIESEKTVRLELSMI